MPISISIVIPAANEANRLRGTVESYYEALSHSKEFKSFELILLTNNCRDSTPQIAKELAKKKNIIHADFPYYIGKGGAVIEGFKLAKYEWLAFADSDSSVDAHEFIKLIHTAAHANAKVGSVIASRKKPGAVLDPPQPFYRQIIGEMYALARETLFGLGIRDSQCGAKLFLRKAIEPLTLRERGFSFDVELLWRVKQRGYTIIEQGVVWRDKAGSTVSWFAPFKMLWALICLRFDW